MPSDRIAFEPLAEHHLGLLHGWLQQPHVREFWDDGDRTPGQVRAHYLDDPRDAWLFTLDGQPAGYLQAYPVTPDDDFAAYRAPQGETWGLDLFMGEGRWLGRGRATAVIGAFLTMFRDEHPELRRLLIDPETHNARAIHVYEKAGFQPLALLEHQGKRLSLMSRDIDIL